MIEVKGYFDGEKVYLLETIPRPNPLRHTLMPERINIPMGKHAPNIPDAADQVIAED
jgi:hypothetical protein